MSYLKYFSPSTAYRIKPKSLGWYSWFSLYSLSGSNGKESACNAVDWGSIPGLGRSPGEGNGKALCYSCLENPRDRGTWQAACSPWSCKKSDTTKWLTHTYTLYVLSKRNLLFSQCTSVGQVLFSGPSSVPLFIARSLACKPNPSSPSFHIQMLFVF